MQTHLKTTRPIFFSKRTFLFQMFPCINKNDIRLFIRCLSKDMENMWFIILKKH